MPGPAGEPEHARAALERDRVGRETVRAHPQPSAGPDTHTRAKPSSANQSQIRGTRSGSCRPRVQITVPPCAHSWAQKPIVRRMSSSVMLPNIPHTSTR
jgi:hypothetical protein